THVTPNVYELHSRPIPEMSGGLSPQDIKKNQSMSIAELHSKPMAELPGESVPQKFSTKKVRFELAGDYTFSNFAETSALKRSNFGTIKTVSTEIGEIDNISEA